MIRSKGCAMRQSVPSFQGNKRHAACCGKRSTLSSSGSVFPIPHVTKTSVISCCSPLKGTMCVSGVLEIICGLECGDFTTTWFVKSYLIRIWFCKLLFFRCLRTAKRSDVVWIMSDIIFSTSDIVFPTSSVISGRFEKNARFRFCTFVWVYCIRPYGGGVCCDFAW